MAINVAITRIADRLVQLANQPSDRRPTEIRSIPFIIDPNYQPNLCWETLLSEFGESAVTDAARYCLTVVAAQYANGEVPDHRPMFLAGRWLEMAALPNGPPLSADLVASLVRNYFSPHWYHLLKPLADRYLTEKEVATALLEGLNSHDSKAALISCIAGSRLFRSAGRTTPAAEPEHRRLRTRLEQLAKNDDPDIAEAASAALA